MRIDAIASVTLALRLNERHNFSLIIGARSKRLSICIERGWDVLSVYSSLRRFFLSRSRKVHEFNYKDRRDSQDLVPGSALSSLLHRRCRGTRKRERGNGRRAEANRDNFERFPEIRDVTIVPFESQTKLLKEARTRLGAPSKIVAALGCFFPSICS